MRGRATIGKALDWRPIRSAYRRARWVAALAALLVAGEARAERFRMLVLVASDEHRELAARIKGQTADLDTVVSTAEGSLPPDLKAQIAVARAAGARADVVVWFATEANGDWIAYIARADRVLVRRIGVAPGALSRSASIEAVALAVRTAMTGFAAAGERDLDQDDGRGRGLRAWGELGATGLLDGTRSSGRYGLALRGGAALGRWYFGAGLAYQPSAEIDVASSAEIEVERQQATAVVGVDLLPRPTAPAPRWALGLELGLGAARFRRITTEAGAGLVATPSAVTWSPLVSPGVRAACRVVSGAWLALELGADVVMRPPDFGVQRAAGFDRLSSVWALQPRLALSLLLDWR